MPYSPGWAPADRDPPGTAVAQPVEPAVYQPAEIVVPVAGRCGPAGRRRVGGGEHDQQALLGRDPRPSGLDEERLRTR
jgi:hypothetical protein